MTNAAMTTPLRTNPALMRLLMILIGGLPLIAATAAQGLVLLPLLAGGILAMPSERTAGQVSAEGGLFCTALTCFYAWAFVRGVGMGDFSLHASPALSGALVALGCGIMIWRVATLNADDAAQLYQIFTITLATSFIVYICLNLSGNLAIGKGQNQMPLYDMGAQKRSGSILAIWAMGLAAYHLFHGGRLRASLWAMGALVLALLSGSRAAQLAAFVMFWVMALAYMAPRAALTLIIGGYAAFVASAPWVIKQVSAQFLKSDYIGIAPGSFDARAVIWTDVITAFTDRWLIGHGINSVRLLTSSMTKAKGYEFLQADHAHNLPLTLWYETGIIGVGLALVCLWLLYRAILSLPRHVIMSASVLLAGTMTITLIEYSLWYEWIITFWYSCALIVVVLSRIRDGRGFARHSRNLLSLLPRIIRKVVLGIIRSLKADMILTRYIAPILALPRYGKRAMAIGVDICLCILTVWLAICLRLDSWVILSISQWLGALTSVGLAIPTFIMFGLYRAIFRYAGWAAMMAIFQAIMVYSVLFMTIVMAFGIPDVPRSVGVFQPVLLLVIITVSRIAARLWLGGTYHKTLNRRTMPKVLIYGAGSSGRQVAAALANSNEMRVIGFLDDDVRLHGCILQGATIYSPDDLAGLVEDEGVSDVLLAIPSANRSRRNEILDLISHAGVTVRTLPGLMDLAHGRINVSDIRELDVEDLLGREVVPPDPTLLGKNISSKTVLVSGAGGSIGSEICRQIITNHPTVLVLIEQSELALYAIHQELTHKLKLLNAPPIQIVPLLSSVRDTQRMHHIIGRWRPDTIYHAAAYKHVPLVEYNAAEGIANNVLGTLTLAKVAAELGVQNFVLISTDKAVRPTNIMGASKRLAEQLLQAISAHKRCSTCFSMVRFGNVLDSSGSVVPLFREQIRKGGPLTITHADITRYFMTIPEAAQLVIQAGAMAQGGDVFVLDMGEPVKIIDLARRMIELSGLSIADDRNPYGDIAIQIIGLRPGEKLYEELLISNNPELTSHRKIMKAHEVFMTWEQLEPRLDVLRKALANDDRNLIETLMKELVPEYHKVIG